MRRAGWRPWLGFVLAAIGAALVAGRPVTASWCGPTEPVCSDFWDADAVFVGRVVNLGPEPPSRPVPSDGIRIEGPDDWRPAVLELLEPLRGLEGVRRGDRVAVSLSRMELGVGPHLVYARREQGRLIVRSCWRTKPVGQAAEELAYARGLARSTATTARVFGQLEWESQPHPSGQAMVPPPIPPATVIVTGQGIARRLRVDAEGRFETRLPAGTYDARVEVPTAYTAVVRTGRFVVPDPRACRRLVIEVRWNGRVTGRVVDAEGRPVPGLVIQHTSAAQGRPFYRAGWVRSLDDGTFAIGGLEPGEQTLAIGAELAPTRQAGAAAAALPIVRTLRLDAAQRIDVGTVRLPAGTVHATVRGLVLDAAGRPVTDALVFLGEAGHDTGPVDARTDAAGRYAFAAVPGRRYFVELLPLEGQGDDVLRTEPIEAGTAAGPPPIRLRVAVR